MLKQFLVLLSLIILVSNPLDAAHIVGGIVHYKVQQIDMSGAKTRILVDFRMYRDAASNGAQFEEDAVFGVFQKQSNNQYQLVEAVNVDISSLNDLTFNLGSITLNYQVVDYKFVITLDHGSDYLIAYQRCCRSSNHVNIVKDSETGMALQIEIMAEALITATDSPEISGIPLSVVSSGENFSYDLPIIKDPSTQQSFRFVPPKESGGITDITTGFLGCCTCVRPEPQVCLPPYGNVIFQPNFSGLQPFGMTNQVFLDNQTGRISGRFNMEGKYGYGIEINTSENGVLLSRQILDYDLVAEETLSASELKDNIEFSVFPNPSPGEFKVQLKLPPFYISCQYEIVAQNGEILYSGDKLYDGQNFHFDFPAGIYLLLLYAENKLIGKEKLIIY